MLVIGLVIAILVAFWITPVNIIRTIYKNAALPLNMLIMAVSWTYIIVYYLAKYDLL